MCVEMACTMPVVRRGCVRRPFWLFLSEADRSVMTVHDGLYINGHRAPWRPDALRSSHSKERYGNEPPVRVCTTSELSSFISFSNKIGTIYAIDNFKILAT